MTWKRQDRHFGCRPWTQSKGSKRAEKMSWAMRIAKWFLGAAILSASLVFLASHTLIHAFGFEQNLALARQINNEFRVTLPPRQFHRYCNLNDAPPWISEESADQCSIVHPTHERDCNIMARGFFCRAVQVPNAYGANPAFLKVLGQTIAQQKGRWFLYVNVVVQDVEQHDLATSDSASRRFQTIERSATYRVSGFSMELKPVSGPARICTGEVESCKSVGYGAFAMSP